MAFSHLATSYYTGDYNGDGDTDLLFDNTMNPDIAVWYMVGTELVVGAQVGTLPDHGQVHGVGDFDGDGKSDLLVTGDDPFDVGAYNVSIWQMNGTQPATVTVVDSVSANTHWQPYLLGDFNGDGKTDISFISDVADASNLNQLAIWQMDGTHIASTADVGGIDEAHGQGLIAAADLSGDGKTDFLFYNNVTHDVSDWLMNGLTVQSKNTIGNVNAAGGWDFAQIRTGDFNGDGKADLLFTNSITNGIAVWETDGHQITAAGQAGVLAAGWHFADVGDFNGDGKSDLLFINDSTHGVAVWLMDGTQTITGAQVGTMDPGFTYLGPGQGLQDLNGDHKSDILFQNTTTGAVVAWEMDGTHVVANQQIGTIDQSHGWQVFA